MDLGSGTMTPFSGNLGTRLSGTSLVSVAAGDEDVIGLSAAHHRIRHAACVTSAVKA
jgi:hypothetical protein